MPFSPLDTPSPSLWQWLLSLIVANLTQFFPLLQAAQNALRSRFESAGQYEVLDLKLKWELLDSRGHEALYHKRAKVRFLENNVIAYQDMAWGLGDIFADYKCSPGVPVDFYLEGFRYRILISLRDTKNRGDIEEFHIERRIKDGFIIPDGSVQTLIEQKTHKVLVCVVFPKKRKPSDVRIVEQNAARTTPLSAEHIQTLPDGKVQVMWTLEKPKRFESYILRWTW